MRHQFTLLLLVCVTAILWADTSAAAIHQFTDQHCRQCHLSDPDGNELLFAADIDTLCRQCHTLAASNVHPSGVAIREPGAFPDGFWLDAEGRLNCATCHDPHPEAEREYPNLLRTAAEDKGFCEECHEPATPHTSVTFVAHSKAYTPLTDAAAVADPVTRDCMLCHDPKDPMATFCVLGQKGECSGHIVGAYYEQLAAGNPGLQDRQALPEAISLYEGRVGCASCHSIYSRQDKLLVIDNRESALCRSCHIK